MEYAINPVYERVKIYNDFKDDNYDEFMEKVNELFKKNETSCSINNKKMIEFLIRVLSMIIKMQGEDMHVRMVNGVTIY